MPSWQDNSYNQPELKASNCRWWPLLVRGESACGQGWVFFAATIRSTVPIWRNSCLVACEECNFTHLSPAIDLSCLYSNKAIWCFTTLAFCTVEIGRQFPSTILCVWLFVGRNHHWCLVGGWGSRSRDQKTVDSAPQLDEWLQCLIVPNVLCSQVEK